MNKSKVRNLKRLAHKRSLVDRYKGMSDNEIAQHIKKKDSYTDGLSPQQLAHIKFLTERS